jgi:hypothetical protein
MCSFLLSSPAAERRCARGDFIYLESEDFRLCEGERFAVHFNETFALLRKESVFHPSLQEVAHEREARDLYFGRTLH